MLLGLVLVSPRMVGAQDVIDARAASRIKTHYLEDIDSLHSKVMALANAIPADKYAWRPGAGVRSISEVQVCAVEPDHRASRVRDDG